MNEHPGFDDDGNPTGPQLADANLRDMDHDQLVRLGETVGLDLRAAEDLHKRGEITREELTWVFSDAERVRNELIRRDQEAQSS